MDIRAGGNVFIRPNILRAGKPTVDGHTHNFDHVTIIFSGAVNVKERRPATDANGNEIWVVTRDQNFVAPAHLLIHRGAKHEITKLTENAEFWCVYAHRTPQAEEYEARLKERFAEILGSTDKVNELWDAIHDLDIPGVVENHVGWGAAYV